MIRLSGMHQWKVGYVRGFEMQLSTNDSIQITSRLPFLLLLALSR